MTTNHIHISIWEKTPTVAYNLNSGGFIFNTT